jgi:hypothetical protein
VHSREKPAAVLLPVEVLHQLVRGLGDFGEGHLKRAREKLEELPSDWLSVFDFADGAVGDASANGEFELSPTPVEAQGAKFVALRRECGQVTVCPRSLAPTRATLRLEADRQWHDGRSCYLPQLN